MDEHMEDQDWMENENPPEEEMEEEASFADLLDAYSQGMNDDVQVGDKISGAIIAVGRESVFVDTGTKIDGVVEKAELLDENGELPYGVGDILELYVVARNESEIRLSRALSGIGGLNLLQDAFDGDIPVDGKVAETCKGGFRVEVLQRRAFCPISQMDLTYVEDAETYVGQTYQFLIARLEESGRNIVVSRRKLLAREQAKARDAFLAELEPDSVIEGRVTRLMPFGAFVEIGPGVEGMVHISELSWSRVEKPDDLLQPGDLLTVKILSMKPREEGGQLKIALSAKQVGGDPWETAPDTFHTGAKIKGKVTRCAPFGAFVEIAPGIEGLVHISEMSYVKRVLKPEDVVTAGETVDVMIKETDWEKRRISLSLRDAEGDPWIEIGDRYSLGQVVAARVEKKEKFGYFITLEPGVTGLLPKSKFRQSAQPTQIERLTVGSAINVLIEEIHADDRKITLAPGDSRDTDDWQSYTQPAGQAVGSLGEKLQQALSKKK